jgi:flagellar basal-body rod protein FlgB
VVEPLDNVTRSTALAALDGYWLQQQVLASNIANQATPGYKAQTVDFERYLGELDAAVKAAGGDTRVIDDLRPQLLTTSEDVQLDAQIAELTKNSLQYQAVLTALTRLQSLNRIAVGGNAA